jgi:hypothetical protein
MRGELVASGGARASEVGAGRIYAGSGGRAGGGVRFLFYVEEEGRAAGPFFSVFTCKRVAGFLSSLFLHAGGTRHLDMGTSVKFTMG